MFNIAFLIDKYGGKSIGGGEVHLKFLTKYLSKNHNCQYQIFSQSRDALWARFLWDFWVMPQVIAAHLQKPFDLLHSHGFSSGPAVWILGKILRIPIIHTVHGSHLMDLRDKSTKGQLEKFFLTKIPYDLEITVSQSFMQYHTQAKKVEVITNGVEVKQNTEYRIQNLEYRIRNSEKQMVKEKFSLAGEQQSDAESITLLTVSRLEPQKGIDILIKALVNIKDQLPPFQLRIVGDGSMLKNFKLQTTNYKLPITFLGKKTGKKLEKEYQNADLFILPSLAEGQPIVLLEAWAHKLPVVATKVGHNPFMITEGVNGWLVKSHDVKSLQTVLLKAISQRALWSKMGEDGFKQVNDHYTWDIIAAKTYGAYERL